VGHDATRRLMARKRAFIPPIERVRGGFVFNIGSDERELVTRLLTVFDCFDGEAEALASFADQPVSQ